METKRLPHIVLRDPPEKRTFTSTKSGGNSNRVPSRDRESHSAFLQNKLRQAWNEAENEQAVYHITRKGVYLEFKGEQGYDLVTKSLEERRSRDFDNWIRLLNIRSEKETRPNPVTGEQKEIATTYATIFVPHTKKNCFFDKIERYANETNPKSGKPKNLDLINSIADLRKALDVDSFWQDAKSLIPAAEPVWCEVWLSSDKDEAINRLEKLLNELQIKTQTGVIRFPERAVKVIQADRSRLELLTRLSDDIAEYRRAKETAAFWTDLSNRSQSEWVQDLLKRVVMISGPATAVCILDTGVNNGHPLLKPILADADCQTVIPAWGTHDHGKHGTLMAGIAGYGNLMECLSSNRAVEMRHCLESVKILPIPPDQTEPKLWGDITAQGVSLAEIQSPERKRTICLAVSAEDTRDAGRPSSWSGALDKLASGCDGDDGIRRLRLIVVSAGNITDINEAKDYPHAQLQASIHDPGQSWNSLTVGAYTALDTIADPTMSGYEPVAPKGGLSPFTTTSCTWDDKWPIKPEVIMEGGNIARDCDGFASECDDLSLISTFYDPQQSHFFPFNMTSAATANASWFAAQIQASYPDLWPETVRALMVHSAEWPQTLKKQFLENDAKSSLKRVLRIAGYGVPDLERALYSASNSLTLISQAELQPFDKKEDGKGYRTKDMHLHELPWPKDVLLNLPVGTEMEMRVTLSYFIEPGPGEIGWRDRYRYASHALRFDLNSPEESNEEFIKRINAAARNEDEGRPSTQSASKHWVIGSQARNRGSIHSDIWRGTAADLAASNLIAVSPRIGWWRERTHIGKWNCRTRYALVVSIRSPEESVDIYTPVANRIGITIPM